VSDPLRSIFFGLRTNVQFFASHLGYSALETRLKIFSLLYDQIVVERGIYEAHIGEQGSWEFVTAEPVRPEQLRPIRTKRGTPFGVAIQREGSNISVPIIGTTLVKAYRAQFYSVLEKAVGAKADWIGFAEFGPGGMHSQVDNAAGELTRRWSWEERDLAKSVFPGQPRYLRDKAYSSLNLDLARAVILGLALAPDGIHAPLLVAKANQSTEIETQPAGNAALALVLPDVRHASWRDIAAIRRDKGLRHLRDRLRELEAGAQSAPLLEQEVREALLAEVEQKMPNWGSTAIDATVNVIASPIPLVSTVVTAISAGKEVAETWKDRSHWTAALVRARKRLSTRRAKARTR
jgi:hypothetical protein